MAILACTTQLLGRVYNTETSATGVLSHSPHLSVHHCKRRHATWQKAAVWLACYEADGRSWLRAAPGQALPELFGGCQCALA